MEEGIESVGSVNTNQVRDNSYQHDTKPATGVTQTQPTPPMAPPAPKESTINTKDKSTISDEAREEMKPTGSDKKEPASGQTNTDKYKSMYEEAKTKKEMFDTMNKSKKGDKDSVIKNTENIMNKTKEPFKKEFVEKYKAENGGKEPTKEQIEKAHNEEFLKSFTHQKYKFDQLAGIEPEKRSSAFKDPMVEQMMASYPDKINLKNKDGSEVKDLSVNHMLSGVQYHGTDADSIKSAMQKYTVGQGVNSHLAESLKPTGIFGEIHKNGEEPGHSGIWAGSSRDLQKEFMNNPVEGMKKFLDNPSQYIKDGMDPKTILLTPAPVLQKMLNPNADLST